MYINIPPVRLTAAPDERTRRRRNWPTANCKGTHTTHTLKVVQRRSIAKPKNTVNNEAEAFKFLVALMFKASRMNIFHVTVAGLHMLIGTTVISRFLMNTPGSEFGPSFLLLRHSGVVNTVPARRRHPGVGVGGALCV